MSPSKAKKGALTMGTQTSERAELQQKIVAKYIEDTNPEYVTEVLASLIQETSWTASHKKSSLRDLVKDHAPIEVVRKHYPKLERLLPSAETPPPEIPEVVVSDLVVSEPAPVAGVPAVDEDDTSWDDINRLIAEQEANRPSKNPILVEFDDFCSAVPQKWDSTAPFLCRPSRTQTGLFYLATSVGNCYTRHDGVKLPEWCTVMAKVNSLTIKDNQESLVYRLKGDMLKKYIGTHHGRKFWGWAVQLAEGNVLTLWLSTKDASNNYDERGKVAMTYTHGQVVFDPKSNASPSYD